MKSTILDWTRDQQIEESLGSSRSSPTEDEDLIAQPGPPENVEMLPDTHGDEVQTYQTYTAGGPPEGSREQDGQRSV